MFIVYISWNLKIIYGDIWICSWIICLFLDNLIFDPLTALLTTKIKILIHFVKFRGYYIPEHKPQIPI